MNITIVGLGLIGGCVGLDLRKAAWVTQRTGVDLNPKHRTKAVELGLIDGIETGVAALRHADLIVMAIPVNALCEQLPQVLDSIKPGAVVIDLGSTKSAICRAVASHPNRKQFVAAHPLAGTENSGPEAAFAGLFSGKINIICEREKSALESMAIAENFFSVLGMKTIFMDPEEHDKHVAYVSHLSHVSSFLLSQTVLDIEKDAKNIFNLAGSGFSSTVRLAKSSPEMWAPIFEQNAEYLGQALAEYIMHLQRFHDQLMKQNTNELFAILKEANKIRHVLDMPGSQTVSGESEVDVFRLNDTLS